MNNDKRGVFILKYGIINKTYEMVYCLKCKDFLGSNTLSRFLLKFADPIIKTSINGQKCYIHFSHMGVYYMHRYPLYDKNIGTICRYLKSIYDKNLSVIDVGANVGDTILCIGDKDNNYYAFEGEKKYYSLLRMNLKNYRYKLFPCYCGDSDKNDSFSIDYDKGTGKLSNKKSNTMVEIRTVDSVLKNVNKSIDFIKIDTDGFDFAVIRGMKNIIQKFNPVLYFEWTMPELISNNENVISIFEDLLHLGYDKGIVFDKYGYLLCTIDTNDLKMLRQLSDYALSSDIYYDVCLIHNDSCIAITDLVTYLRSK